MICSVLILIVVEYGLGVTEIEKLTLHCKGLNPYCSGIWSRSLNLLSSPTQKISLNPYCSGIWSRSTMKGIKASWPLSLNPYCSGIWSRSPTQNDTFGISHKKS